ncbi:hypothetical protein Tco_0510608 [Tanacetum coccineum]
MIHRIVKTKKEYFKSSYKKKLCGEHSGFQRYDYSSLRRYKKGINAKVSHEEVLQIKERDVNERRKKERHVIELEILKLEKMIQKEACSNTGNAQRAKQSKKKCLIHFRLLHTLLEDFSKEDLTNACFSSGFHRAFSSLFGEDVEYFTPRLFFNMDKLEKQLNAEEFNEEIAIVVFKVLKNQLQQFITMQISMDSDDQKINHFFTEYTLCDAQMVNEKTMQTHEGMMSKDASEIDNNVAGASHDKDNIIEVQGSNNEMFAKNFTKTKNASEMFEETKTNHKKLAEENVLLKKEIETYKEWVRDLNETQYIKKLEQEKEYLQDQVLKIKNATKAFKQDEDKYVNNIIQLEAKNKDLEKIKMGLGYMDPCPIGQAIACHPKLYDAEVLGLHYVKPDVYDIEEILNDAEESQVKMKEKQFQFNYENINSIYDMFVPQTELSPEQEKFSNPSTSNVSIELSLDESDVPPKEMPNEVPISRSLNECSTIIQQEITEEVKEMLYIFVSMERNSYVEIKNKEEIDRFSKESKDSEKFCNDVVEVKEKLSKQIVQLEKDFVKLEAQSIAFEITLQHKT